MNFYSMTQAGQLAQIAAFIVLIAKLLNSTADEEQIKQAVFTIGNGIAAAVWLVGACVSWYGRYRHGDLTLAGIKKNALDKLNSLLR